MKVNVYGPIMFFYNRPTRDNEIKSAIYYSKEKKMNKNVQFYVLFTILSVSFLDPSLLWPRLPRPAVSQKRIKVNSCEYPPARSLKIKSRCIRKRENQPQQAWTPSKYKYTKLLTISFKDLLPKLDILPMQKKAKG